MRVTVKTPEGDSYGLDVKGTDTVAETKKKIEAASGRAVASQNLFFGGVALEDDKTLSHYKINFFATIRMHGASFPVHISVMDGGSITVNVEENDVLMTIHDAIRSKKNLSPHQYKLMLQDVEDEGYIEDEGKSMAHYGIKSGSTLLLIPMS
eukprot:CAMPEP_0201539656 /NCGR_PEP_ID=MMETSP0161_2-20130828/70524_1 /ASSEMBLY_ACC=CAM_ASM_000251 /TAXON_ID=180227 /ORGANISM="Neoparamoeba aestuarina, Strain SoJaBio B1-5/56/2" /LENGTH=151 /DNA_ID=CAMNT_0047947067 /DNA_START=474 /DNA_END=929 /DNA_ORIENTATION=-